MRYKPYKYKSPLEMKIELSTNIKGLGLSESVSSAWIDLAFEAVDSKEWDYKEEYNGCTIVQDYLHPSPACWIHDYTWITGMGGKDADRLFLKLMLLEGMPKFKALRRFSLVRIGWFTYFNFKYKLQKNKRGNTSKMNDLITELK